MGSVESNGTVDIVNLVADVDRCHCSLTSSEDIPRYGSNSRVNIPDIRMRRTPSSSLGKLAECDGETGSPVRAVLRGRPFSRGGIMLSGEGRPQRTARTGLAVTPTVHL